MKEIYLAGGCFWGVDAYFSKLDGICSTTAGYANGNTDKTRYEDLQITDHAETVRIIYDEKIISLDQIFEHFYYIIDPFTLNKQANDIGRQYRSGIYSTNSRDLSLAKAFLDAKEEIEDKKIVVEVQPLINFVEAEEYHQDYLKKNPNGYCHINLNDVWEIKDEKN